MNKGLSLIITVILFLQLSAAGEGADNKNNKPTYNSKQTNQKEEKNQNGLKRELKIYRETLLEGSKEQIRKDAAMELIFHDDPNARKILLDVLNSGSQKQAKMVICKVIAETRTTKEDIPKSGAFIDPLLNLLKGNDVDLANMAAEALLAYRYEDIAEKLEGIIDNAEVPVASKLNVIDAMKLQPHQKAIVKLIKLTESSNKQIADAAKSAVKALGIPQGKDAEARHQIIKEIEQKGKDEFLKDWLIRQETQIKNLEGQVNYWKKQYVKSLDKLYDKLQDDAAKGKFLAQQLNGSDGIIKLWILEKIEQWRQAPGSDEVFLKEVGPALIGLISDSSRNVRLRTANLLSIMVQLNSSESLLNQLKVEGDEEVKMALFTALGGACNYAFSSNSGIKLDPEIKKQTVEWAVKYLSDVDPSKAQKGAEVMEKLLRNNGLPKEQVKVYFDKLVERFKAADKKNSNLRADILRVCGTLCVESDHKQEAVKKFRSFFESSLSDESELVREAAVEGLINIDKTKALALFRGGMVNDESAAIRMKIISLAEEVGNKNDLSWLIERLGVNNNEGEAAWNAMMKILGGAEPAVVNQWLNQVEIAYKEGNIADEQMLGFLKLASDKAGKGKLADMSRNVKKQIADVYIKRGNYQEAAKHLGELQEMMKSSQEKEKLVAELLDVYLKWPNVKSAKQLIEKHLLESDLGKGSVVVKLLDEYFARPVEGTDPAAVYNALNSINIEQKRPQWQNMMNKWGAKFAKAETKQAKKTESESSSGNSPNKPR